MIAANGVVARFLEDKARPSLAPCGALA